MKSTDLLIIGGSIFTVLYLIMRKPLDDTGKSVAPATAERVMAYAGLMMKYGMEQGVDPALIASVITVESSGIEGAVGSSGEVGLMQIMPTTGAWVADVTAEQLLDPAINIQTGTAYLRYCIDRKDGNGPAGVAAYNYGPDRVVMEGGNLIIPTVVRDYVDRVFALLEPYREMFRRVMGNAYQIPLGVWPNLR